MEPERPSRWHDDELVMISALEHWPTQVIVQRVARIGW